MRWHNIFGTLFFCPASLAGFSLHHAASWFSVMPYFFPYDHVTGRTNCRYLCQTGYEACTTYPYRQQLFQVALFLNMIKFKEFALALLRSHVLVSWKTETRRNQPAMMIYLPMPLKSFLLPLVWDQELMVSGLSLTCLCARPRINHAIVSSISLLEAVKKSEPV